MGYLSCPRIYFFGQFRMDAATGNNFQQVKYRGQQYEFFSVADVTVNTKFGDRELSDAEMRQFLAGYDLPNWNYGGSNGFSFPEVSVTGYDLGQGVQSQGDALIGAPVKFKKALMVSLNPAGLLSAQMISDSFVLGDSSTMGLSGPPARAFSRWIWFGRNPIAQAPPGVPGWVSASAVYQTAIPAGELASQAGGSQAVKALLQTLEEQGKGITVRFCLYATTIRKETNLTPAWGYVSGVIGVQSPGDLNTYPVARRLNPTPNNLQPVSVGMPGTGPFGLGPAFAQVDSKGKKVVLDLITTIPEDSRVLEERSKFDFGNLSLRLVEPSGGGQPKEVVVGTLGFDDYCRSAYDATSGIAEIDVAEGVTAEMLENWDFRLTQDNPPGSDSPIVALREEELFAASDDDSIYLQQNQPGEFPLHFFRKGKPAGPVSWSVEQFVTTGVENPPPHPDPPGKWIIELPRHLSSGPGSCQVPLNPLTPGTCTFRFTPPGGDRQGPLGRLTDSLVLARVLPEDDYSHISDEQLKGSAGFQLIYREVFRYYYLLYPVMQQFVNFSDEKSMRSNASNIQMAIDKKLLPNWAYMPRTRELSDGKRKLVERWIDLVLKEGG